jgi:hypothetical protein
LKICEYKVQGKEEEEKISSRGVGRSIRGSSCVLSTN